MTPHAETADHPTSNVIPFVFEEQLVRIVQIDGEPWFAAKDVCAVLNIKDHHQAVERLDLDERGGCSVPTPSGAQDMTVISESGLYALVFTSRKPEAKRFRKWVTSEVLPAIRRTGRFDLREAPAQPAPFTGDGDLPLQELAMKIAVVREARHTFGVKQARQTWRALNLPFVEETSSDFALSQSLQVLAEIFDAKAPGGELVRDLVCAALDGNANASHELSGIGIKIDDVAGVILIANKTAFLRSVFKGRLGQHFLALRQIPGAFVPNRAKWFGGRHSRCTAVPLAEIENELFGERDIFQSEEAA